MISWLIPRLMEYMRSGPRPLAPVRDICMWRRRTVVQLALCRHHKENSFLESRTDLAVRQRNVEGILQGLTWLDWRGWRPFQSQRLSDIRNRPAAFAQGSSIDASAVSKTTNKARWKDKNFIKTDTPLPSYTEESNRGRAESICHSIRIPKANFLWSCFSVR